MTDADWSRLRHLTQARIGLSRSGPAVSTGPLLEMRLAQARARDAVHAELDIAAIQASLATPAPIVASLAPDRRTYLLRPDLGRSLDPAGASALEACAAPDAEPYDLAVVIADGLAAGAARHAGPLLTALLPTLRGWSLAPPTIARHARVGLGDHIALAVNARAVLILIGERPGLTAPDSLGAYLTYAPGPGTTDAGRNCVSNIRPDGLGYAPAAQTLTYLLHRMRSLQSSGIGLKDLSTTVRQLPAE